MEEGFEVFQKLLFRVYSDTVFGKKFILNTTMTVTRDETHPCIEVRLNNGEKHSQLEVPLSDLLFNEMFDMSHMWVVALSTVESLIRGIDNLEEES